jgi:DNA-binding PadR family transcriptional regulator
MELTKILSQKHAISVLLFLLDKGSVKQNELLEVIPSNLTIEKLGNSLEEAGLINITHQMMGRKIFIYSLSERGHAVALKLKETLEAVDGISSEKNILEIPSNYDSQFRNLSMHGSLNVLDDRIGINETNWDRAGHDRVVFIYVKLNENNIMRLWCEVDNTYDCVHTKYAWSLPDVQAMVQVQYARGNVKKFEQS